MLWPRRVKESLKEKPVEQAAPVQVIDSLEFADDLQETMPLAPGELEGLAKDFEKFRIADEHHSLPEETPTVFWQHVSC